MLNVNVYYCYKCLFLISCLLQGTLQEIVDLPTSVNCHKDYEISMLNKGKKLDKFSSHSKKGKKIIYTKNKKMDQIMKNITQHNCSPFNTRKTIKLETFVSATPLKLKPNVNNEANTTNKSLNVSKNVAMKSNQSLDMSNEGNKEKKIISENGKDVFSKSNRFINKVPQICAERKLSCTRTNEGRLHCKYCNYKTAHTGAMKVHVRTHTGEGLLSCEYCDYKTAQAGNMKVHVRTHTGEGLLSCEYCDYKTARAGDMKVHVRSHTGEGLLSCEYCDYKTVHTSAMKVHVRTHTGEGLLSCEYCDYKTAQAGNMKRHVKHKHS